MSVVEGRTMSSLTSARVGHEQQASLTADTARAVRERRAIGELALMSPAPLCPLLLPDIIEVHELIP